MKPAAPDFELEQSARLEGLTPVAGVDEAGRGPWAGPVVAAAVILDAGAIPFGLNDSKKLSEACRNDLYEQLMRHSDVGIGIADVARIDRDNILKATLWAMGEALTALKQSPRLALIDGNRCAETAITCKTVIKGDGKSLSIAAASIIAKVSRDRLMAELDSEYPDYGFARHKGYGTALHHEMLKKHGPCPAHRRSFAPIKRVLAETGAYG